MKYPMTAFFCKPTLRAWRSARPCSMAAPEPSPRPPRPTTTTHAPAAAAGRCPVFDCSGLTSHAACRSRGGLDVCVRPPLEATLPAFRRPAPSQLGQRLVEAKEPGRALILMMGGHVLRAGVSRFIIG